MNEEQELLLNTVAILGILLENLDELEQQKFYARGMKFHGKSLMREAESISNQVFRQIPESGQKEATAAYMEYYRKNAELIRLVVNTPIEKKDSIFKILKEAENGELPE